jgi:hypothetical protein
VLVHERQQALAQCRNAGRGIESGHPDSLARIDE